MRFQNSRWGRLASRPGLYYVPSVLESTLGITLLSLLMFMGPGICYQIPSSTSTTLSGPAPPSPQTSIATSSLSSQDRTIVYKATNTHIVSAEDEHMIKDDGMSRQAAMWTLNHRIPLDWAGVQTFEAVTSIASKPMNTVSPDYSTQNGNRQSSISIPASISKDPPINCQVDNLKRSAGIFVIIKAILISWAILLVGMLTYMLVRFVEEMRADVPSLEVESDEDDERTALLGQDTV